MKADKFDLYFCCNSVEASGDLKKLEAAHESVGHSIMPLLKLCNFVMIVLIFSMCVYIYI